MQITYDREADAFALVAPGAKSARTVRVSEGVNFDYDLEGKLISIEILNASRVLSADLLAVMPLAEVRLTLSEAAERAELSPDTLRSLINKRRLIGQKQGRDWTVSLAELYMYLDSRQSSGRPGQRVSTQSLRTGDVRHVVAQSEGGTYRIARLSKVQQHPYGGSTAGKRDVHTVHNHSGGWVNKVAGEIVSKHGTQENALERARTIAKQNKAEHVIHGRDGKIRDKKSYGNDPTPPRDKGKR